MATGVDSSQPRDLPDLATRAQVAKYTQTSYATLSRWAAEHKGPPTVRLGSAIRYERDSVLAWIASQRTSAEASS